MMSRFQTIRSRTSERKQIGMVHGRYKTTVIYELVCSEVGENERLSGNVDYVNNTSIFGRTFCVRQNIVTMILFDNNYLIFFISTIDAFERVGKR